MLFLFCSNRVFTEGTCKLLNLVVTDLVDEDLVLNRRKQAASALLFGMVALVTKPGQTFAPLIGTWLLCAYTGKDASGESSGAGQGRPVSSVSAPCAVPWVGAEGSSVANLCLVSASPLLVSQRDGQRSIPTAPFSQTLL